MAKASQSFSKRQSQLGSSSASSGRGRNANAVEIMIEALELKLGEMNSDFPRESDRNDRVRKEMRMLGNILDQIKRSERPETEHDDLTNSERDLKLAYLAQAYQWVGTQLSMRSGSQAQQ